MHKSNWTEEEKEYIRTHYLEQTEHDISQFLGKNPRSIGWMAKQLGIRKGWGKTRYRLYQVNEAFFKSWSPEMAYVLGLIMADGNVGEREFNIVSADLDLLETVKKALDASHPITSPGKNWFRLRIGSKTMVNDLLSLGITPRKSLTIRLPAVPNEFFFHLLRGYFDGDGMAKIQSNMLHLKITSGSKYLLEDFSERISSNLTGIRTRIVKERIGKTTTKPTCWYELYYGGVFALRIAERMYDHAENLYLSRKREIFDWFTPSENALNRELVLNLSATEKISRKRENARRRQTRYRKRKQTNSSR